MAHLKWPFIIIRSKNMHQIQLYPKYAINYAIYAIYAFMFKIFIICNIKSMPEFLEILIRVMLIFKSTTSIFLYILIIICVI